MQQIGNTGEGTMALLPLIWVLVLMMAVAVSVVARKRNKRMNKRIGVEMEIIKAAHIQHAPNEKLATWLTKHGVESYDAGYTHEVVDRTKVVSDASLNRGGIEIVSPPLLGADGDSWISKVCNALKRVAGVDTSCGLHIHIGLRTYGEDFNDDDFDQPANRRASQKAQGVVGRVAYAYGWFQTVLNSMVSESRRNGQYSRNTEYLVDLHPNLSSVTNSTRDWDEDGNVSYIENIITDPTEVGVFLSRLHANGNPAGWDSRYQCVNPHSFGKYGTIEFRSHQGTTNPSKIQNWSNLLYLLVARCASDSWVDIHNYDRESYGAFMEWLGVAPSDPLYQAQMRRIRVLNGASPLVFRNDPDIQLSQLFEVQPSCTNCGSLTCDHDDVCGTNPSPTQDIIDHFNTPSYGVRTCTGCREFSIEDAEGDGYEVRNGPRTSSTYCANCSEQTTFNMTGGLVLSLLFGASPLVAAIGLLVACGVGAIHAGEKPYKGLKKLTRKLWVGLQDRGRQAAGFAWLKGALGVYYVKSPHSAGALAHHMNKNLQSNTHWVMMHTRFATHGVNNKSNAHPHFGKKAKVTMVHNGVVHNHDDVWMALGDTPHGPVDSQAVAQCLEVGGIEKVVELCEGSMSLIWSDERDPKGTLKCWTNGGNPLVMGRLDDATNGPVIIASTLAIMNKAAKKRVKTDWDCHIGREYTIHPDGSITKRDIEGSADSTGVTYYDWRDYVTTGGVTTYKGKSNNTDPDNFTVYGQRKPSWRIQNLAKKAMGFHAAGSFDPIESKWDGYDAMTHEGICHNQWDEHGEPIRYTLPQWFNPAKYQGDLVALLRGDHAPDKTDDFSIAKYDAVGNEFWEI